MSQRDILRRSHIQSSFGRLLANSNIRDGMTDADAAKDDDGSERTFLLYAVTMAMLLMIGLATAAIP
jgi:hypothetical protein